LTTIASLVVKIGADATGLSRGLTDADTKVKSFGSGISGTQIGVLGIVAAVGGIGVAAVNAAIEWESAFAGVEKTVNGSAEELQALEDTQRDMATDTSNPVAGLENAAVTLAKIAEMGGSLGIATEDLDEFTQTIALLDMTTDLTAESAAMMTAQFANITGMKVEDYDNFGSALVDLGNKMAATEPQILEFASRMAAAGDRAGLSEADILGFAAAMASLGLEAEAGGTAFNQTINTIVEAVGRGGPELDALAAAAGTTAAAFADSWADDPAAALVSFLEGLGEMSPADQLATLDALGLSGIRVSDALSRMSGNTELVTQGLDVANQAWEENNALQSEAEKRFATTESQMNLMNNNVKELGVELGTALLPVLNDVVTGVTDFLGALNDGDASAAGNDILDLVEGIWNLGNDDPNTQLQLPDFDTVIAGWQTFGDSLGIIVQYAGDKVNEALNNIAVGLRSFGREIETIVTKAQIAYADLNMATGIDWAYWGEKRDAGYGNLNAIEDATALEQQIRDSLAAGDLNIDMSEFVTTDPALLAQKLVDPVLMQAALTQALTENDQAALTALVPIAMEMGIDTQALWDQFYAKAQEAGALGTADVTITADVTVNPGSIDLSPVLAGIGNATQGKGFGAGVGQGLPALASGGYIESAGVAMLHDNELVLNAAQTQEYMNGNRGGSSSGNVVTLNSNMTAEQMVADLERLGIYLRPGMNAA
jgi:TP901 family phage tail tape measure protein